jgi:hypothetical protein
VQMGTAGSFGFFAAGNPGALFRYDLKSGRLFRAIGIDDAAPGETSLPVVWDEMSPRLAPATGLPRWSWAVSAHATGAAIPTDAGAVWLTRAPGRRTKTIPLEAAGRSVRAIGGAALVRDAAVVPVSVDGRVRFALWVFDKAAWALVDLDAGPDAPAGDTYAAPVSNGDEAFWSGKAGLLRINESGGTMSGEFVPWPEGFRPQLGIRPVELPDGGFHLFGRIGNQQLAYQAMLPGKATPQRREARGYSISYGGGVFREGKRYRQPCDQDSLATYTVDDGFIAPLLAFAESRFLVAVCSQRTELSKFLETPAGGRLLSCKLAICGPVSSLDPLQQVVEANAVWELMPFVYAGRLFVYAAVENRCWAWPLLAAGPK